MAERKFLAASWLVLLQSRLLVQRGAVAVKLIGAADPR
jgi:hypothetical protein